MTFIDKINSRFPALGKKIKKFSRNRKTTVVQDMLLCTAIALTCAFYEFEGFFPAFATNVLKIVLVILFLMCWLWCSFLNGFWGKYSFLIYTTAFWVIPNIIIKKEESTGILNYSVYLDAASQYSRLLVEFPLISLSHYINTTTIFITVALLSWCFCFYFLGGHFKKVVSNENQV